MDHPIRRYMITLLIWYEDLSDLWSLQRKLIWSILGIKQWWVTWIHILPQFGYEYIGHIICNLNMSNIISYHKILLANLGLHRLYIKGHISYNIGHISYDISALWRHREFSSTNSESASQGLSDPVVKLKIRPALSASRTPYWRHSDYF